MAPIITLDGSREPSDEQKIRRKKTIVRTALAFVTIANVFIFAYVGSVIYSVSRTTVVLLNTGKYTYNYHGTLLDASDDTYDYNFTLTLGNRGLYRIQPITLDINVYVNDSTADPLLVPPGTFFGGLHQVIPAINPGTISNQTLILPVNATTTTMLTLINETVTLRTQFTIDTGVLQFSLHVSGMFYQTLNLTKNPF